MPVPHIQGVIVLIRSVSTTHTNNNYWHATAPAAPETTPEVQSVVVLCSSVSNLCVAQKPWISQSGHPSISIIFLVKSPAKATKRNGLSQPERTCSVPSSTLLVSRRLRCYQQCNGMHQMMSGVEWNISAVLWNVQGDYSPYHAWSIQCKQRWNAYQMRPAECVPAQSD